MLAQWGDPSFCKVQGRWWLPLGAEGHVYHKANMVLRAAVVPQAALNIPVSPSAGAQGLHRHSQVEAWPLASCGGVTGIWNPAHPGLPGTTLACTQYHAEAPLGSLITPVFIPEAQLPPPSLPGPGRGEEPPQDTLGETTVYALGPSVTLVPPLGSGYTVPRAFLRDREREDTKGRRVVPGGWPAD